MRWTIAAVVVCVSIGLGCTGGGTPGPARDEGSADATGPETIAPATPTVPGIAAATRAPDTDDGLVDAAAYFNGGRELDPDGTVDANHAGALFDGRQDAEWACGKNEERCGVIVEFDEPFDLEKLVWIGPTAIDQTVRKLAIETGPGPMGPWTALATIEPVPGREPQSFPIVASRVSFVHLVPLASENPELYAFDDVQLRGKRSVPRTPDWNGGYIETTGSQLEMKQEGERVTGCYGFDDRLEGVADGPVFTGVFHDMEGDVAIDSRIVLVLRPDRGFHGVKSDSMDPSAPLVNRFDGVLADTPVSVHCDAPADEKPDEIQAALARDGRVTLFGVLFDFDKDTLKPESDKVLTALAKAIQEGPERTYRIEGHTDDRGGEAYNLDLSDRRAKSVETWLVGHGCADERLQTQGFGASSPILSNDTPAGRAQNRRVEVSVVE